MRDKHRWIIFPIFPFLSQCLCLCRSRNDPVRSSGFNKDYFLRRWSAGRRRQPIWGNLWLCKHINSVNYSVSARKTKVVQAAGSHGPVVYHKNTQLDMEKGSNPSSTGEIFIKLFRGSRAAVRRRASFTAMLLLRDRFSQNAAWCGRLRSNCWPAVQIMACRELSKEAAHDILQLV